MSTTDNFFENFDKLGPFSFTGLFTGFVAGFVYGWTEGEEPLQKFLYGSFCGLYGAAGGLSAGKYLDHEFIEPSNKDQVNQSSAAGSNFDTEIEIVEKYFQQRKEEEKKILQEELSEQEKKCRDLLKKYQQNKEEDQKKQFSRDNQWDGLNSYIRNRMQHSAEAFS